MYPAQVKRVREFEVGQARLQEAARARREYDAAKAELEARPPLCSSASTSHSVGVCCKACLQRRACLTAQLHGRAVIWPRCAIRRSRVCVVRTLS